MITHVIIGFTQQSLDREIKTQTEEEEYGKEEIMFTNKDNQQKKKDFEEKRQLKAKHLSAFCSIYKSISASSFSVELRGTRINRSNHYIYIYI